MISRSATRRLAWIWASLLAGLLAVGTAIADSTADETKPADQPTDTATAPSSSTSKPFMGDIRNKVLEDMLRMREFFDTTIPGTLKKYKLVFSFSPRSADLRKGEFVRMSAMLRYGLTNRWEIYGAMTPFVPNPINSGVEHRWGTGEGRLGLLYNWGHWGTVFDDVNVGIESRTPLGKPPADIIDSFAHIAPFINTSRPMPFKDTNLYTNITYDRAFDAPLRESPPPGIGRRHVFIVTNSVLYKPGEFGAFVSYSFRHFEDQGVDTHLGHEFRIGPIWDLPLWRTQSWGLPGKWQVEIAARVTTEEGHPIDKGISARVRWRTSIRELFSKKSYQRVPHQ